MSSNLIRYPSGTSKVQNYPLICSSGPCCPPINPSSGQHWWHPEQLTWYTWDGERWISDEKITYNFVKNKNADGTYLKIGSLKNNASEQMLRDARIRYISAFAESGQNDKQFELRLLGSTISIFDFEFTSLSYINENAGVNLNRYDKLQVYCSYSGSIVENPAVTIIICWRL